MPAASSVTRLRRATARLTTEAVTRMAELPWFAALPPEERSYVGLVVQAGLAEFGSWLRDPSRPPKADPAIFSAAPRALARAVTLQQTVQLIRVTVEVLEAAIPTLADAADADALEHAVLRYSREVAFAAAEVYAAAAEERGAWDARSEASVVDALLRGDVGDAALARAGALGWGRTTWVTALCATLPADDGPVGELRAAARRSELSLLVGSHHDQLLVVLGGTGRQGGGLHQVASTLPAGPVVTGAVVAGLEQVADAVQEARAGFAAVAAWPGAPRPVAAEDLLAERAVLGDVLAHRRLVEQVYRPLYEHPDLLQTAATYLDSGGVIETTARGLYLHPNTVRYRLARIRELAGRDLTVERQAQQVRLALVLGRTAGDPPPPG